MIAAVDTTGQRMVLRTFSPRIRFNWGFHTGASDQRTHCVALWDRGSVARHFDSIYVEGYRAGQDAVKAGTSTESSEPAWREKNR